MLLILLESFLLLVLLKNYSSVIINFLGFVVLSNFLFVLGDVCGMVPASAQSEADSSNTTIFVGGLDQNVSDDELRQPFSQHGEIVSVKIPVGKGCGFVQFADRKSAEEALEKLNGTVIGKQTVRLSWGRNPANKQFRADFGNQWGGSPYYGGQVYEAYGGYAMPSPHDSSMYAAAYGAYPAHYGNGSHQQQVS